MATTTQTKECRPVVLPDGSLNDTKFAVAYKSVFTLQPRMKTLLPTIPHVNCGYLSTAGVAPTLTELKQHAQSLVILIKYLTVNTLPGLINNAEAEIDGAPKFDDGETYDFLNDLGESYKGPKSKLWERHYNMPLTALLNVLQEDAAPRTHHRNHDHDHDMDADDDGDVFNYNTTDICPLHQVHPEKENQVSLPYATHQALISHANEVLEMLDHQYSAKGGLLSILPPPEQKEDRALAETTLLGQLIIYMQRLVQRVHELERQYANAMDALAGEAVVPSQTLSKLGPDGRAPREMVYPQDRFVLVNAGEDVWQFLHKEFEKKEVVDEYIADENRKNGLLGPTAYAPVRDSNDDMVSRGLTAIDITTRYYRLRKDPLKTIFVIPAHKEHPGTQATIQLESEPTVVNVVKPVWPERHSMWEMKNRKDLDAFKQLKQDHALAQQTLQVKTTAESLLLADNKLKDGEISMLKKEMDRVKRYMREPENKRYEVTMDAIATANKTKVDYERSVYALHHGQEDLKAEAAALAQDKADLTAQAQKIQADLKMSQDILDARSVEIEHERLAGDEANVKYAQDLTQTLEDIYRTKINEAQISAEYLRQKAVAFTTDVPTKEVFEKGKRESDKLVDAIFKTLPTPPASSRGP